MVQCSVFHFWTIARLWSKRGRRGEKTKMEAEPRVIKLLGHSRNKRCVNCDSANAPVVERDSASPTQAQLGADLRRVWAADNRSPSSFPSPDVLSPTSGHQTLQPIRVCQPQLRTSFPDPPFQLSCTQIFSADVTCGTQAALCQSFWPPPLD